MELLGYFAAVFLNKASSLSLTKLYLWRSTLSRLWFPSVYLSPYMFLTASVNSYSSFDLPVWLSQACGVVRSTAKQWVHRASHKDQSSLTGGKKGKILSLTGVGLFSINTRAPEWSFSTSASEGMAETSCSLVDLGTQGKIRPSNRTERKNASFFFFCRWWHYRSPLLKTKKRARPQLVVFGL